MSKSILAFSVFALSLLLLPLQAQQKRNVATQKQSSVAPRQNVNPVAKLNNEQKKHLKLYKDISNAVSAGKVDRKKVFQRYYELFSSSADELVKANKEKADEMKIRAGEALDSNNENLSKKCNDAAALYRTMADEILKLPELYKMGKKAQMDAGLKRYLEAEASLIKLGAKPCPRRWLTTKEAEACLVAISKSMARNTKQK